MLLSIDLLYIGHALETWGGDLATWATGIATVWALQQSYKAVRIASEANKSASTLLTIESARREDEVTQRRLEQASKVSARIVGLGYYDNRDLALQVLNRSTGPIFEVSAEILADDVKASFLEQGWSDEDAIVVMRPGRVDIDVSLPGIEPDAIDVRYWPSVDEVLPNGDTDPRESRAAHDYLTKLPQEVLQATFMEHPGADTLTIDAALADPTVCAEALAATMHKPARGWEISGPRFASGKVRLRFTDQNGIRWQLDPDGRLQELNG